MTFWFYYAAMFCYAIMLLCMYVARRLIMIRRELWRLNRCLLTTSWISAWTTLSASMPKGSTTVPTFSLMVCHQLNHTAVKWICYAAAVLVQYCFTALAQRIFQCKVKPSTCIVPCMVQTTLKCSSMDHTVLPATNNMPALPRKCSPDGATQSPIEVADI